MNRFEKQIYSMYKCIARCVVRPPMLKYRIMNMDPVKIVPYHEICLHTEHIQRNYKKINNRHNLKFENFWYRVVEMYDTEI